MAVVWVTTVIDLADGFRGAQSWFGLRLCRLQVILSVQLSLYVLGVRFIRIGLTGQVTADLLPQIGKVLL